MNGISKKSMRDLVSALDIGPRELVALVGGGGKSSLLFALSEELLEGKKQVVTSTTTKVRHDEALRSPLVLFTDSEPSWKDKLRDGLENHGNVFLGRALLNSGKVDGISPSIADEMYQGGGIDYIILEADGSSGRPVKVPADHEPVIPSSTTKVVAMLGLEAIGEEMGPEVVFRTELFGRLTGLESGDQLTPEILSRLFLEPGGLFKGTPPTSKKLVFLNKRDLLSKAGEDEDLANLILGSELCKVEQVVIGSIWKREFTVFR